MRLIIVVLAGLLAEITAATATATLVCEADDTSIALFVQAALGGLRRAQVVNFGGKLDIKLRSVPADLRSLELARDDLQQSWLDGKTLKLELYRERAQAPGAYVRLLVDTRKVDENRYRGRYVLEADVADASNTFGSKPRRVDGKAG